ncbi:hypothetical protein D3C81_1752530 [compost metagenome]
MSSAALSIRSLLLSISASTCSLAAAPESSAAARPDNALSDSSAFRLALPRRSSSAAAPLAPLTALPAAEAADFKCAPASPRCSFKLSVLVGLIVISRFQLWAPVCGARVTAGTTSIAVVGCKER